jgi:hypothetical protein
MDLIGLADEIDGTFEWRSARIGDDQMQLTGARLRELDEHHQTRERASGHLTHYAATSCKLSGARKET